MGCINAKVAPIPENIRIRTKKERKMLKKALKKQGIRANVTKSGVTFVIPISDDFCEANCKLPPISINSGKLLGNKEHIHCSTSDVLETEIKRKIYFCFVLPLIYNIHVHVYTFTLKVI